MHRINTGNSITGRRFSSCLIVAFIIRLITASPAHCQGTQPDNQAQAQQTALSPVKLEAAVNTAVNDNPTLKNSLLDASIARDRISAARSQFYPHVKVSTLGLQLLTPLNFGFDKGVFGSFASTGPIPSQNTNVSTGLEPVLIVNTLIAQPISQIPRIRLGVRQLEIAQEIARQKFKVQRQQLVSDVKHAYYKALELEDALKVVQATETLYQEIERTTNEYRQRKMVLPADAIEVKQQLANTQYEALKLRNALASQKEELNHMLGRNLQSNLTLFAPGDAPEADIDLAAAITRAKNNRAELRQAQMQSEQIDLERKIKKLQYLPELSVAFDYLSVFGTQVLPRNVVMAGLLLNWEPIDWGRRHAEISEQRKLWHQANNSMHETETQITIEVNNAYRSLQEGKQFLQVAQLGRQLALERLRVATDKYAAQAVLLKDVLQAQRDLTQANNQYSQAVLALWRARADFQKAVGEE